MSTITIDTILKKYVLSKKRVLIQLEQLNKKKGKNQFFGVDSECVRKVFNVEIHAIVTFNP